MRIFYASAFLLLLLCYISGCALIDPFGEADRPHTSTMPSNINGSWRVNRQDIYTYVNGKLMSAFTYGISDANRVAYIKFNNDGTYNSQSMLYSDITGQLTVIARSDVSGAYSYSPSAFTISNQPASLNLTVNTVAVSDAPLIAVTAQSAKVDDFRANLLNFTTQITENYTLHDTSSVHLIVTTYYLNR